MKMGRPPAVQVFIGKRLRDLRIRLDIPQEEIAAALETNQGQYSRWENSRVNPAPDKIMQMVAFFRAKGVKVSPDYFLDDTIFTVEGQSSDVRDEGALKRRMAELGDERDEGTDADAGIEESGEEPDVSPD